MTKYGHIYPALPAVS